MAIDELGREVPDPRPVEVPLDFKRPLTIQEEIQRFVRVEMSKRAEEHGFETFQDADDFDVPDEDGEFVSPYEMTEMQEERPFLAEQEAQPGSPAEPAKQGVDPVVEVSKVPEAAQGAEAPKPTQHSGLT